MAKKKKMSKAEAAKTIVKETVKTAKLKRKIADRKRTNKTLRKMNKGSALTTKDSQRAASAVAKKKERKKK